MNDQTELEFIKQQLTETRNELRLMREMLEPILISADHLNKVKGLNKNTISQNNKIDKYNGIGKRKVLLTLESVTVLQQPKRAKKWNK